MGTADYCLMVVALFFGLVVFSIHRDEKRRLERRQSLQGIPAFIEKRGVAERRGSSMTAYVAWAFRAQLAKLQSWFKPGHP